MPPNGDPTTGKRSNIIFVRGLFPSPKRSDFAWMVSPFVISDAVCRDGVRTVFANGSAPVSACGYVTGKLETGRVPRPCVTVTLGMELVLAAPRPSPPPQTSLQIWCFDHSIETIPRLSLHLEKTARPQRVHGSARQA